MILTEGERRSAEAALSALIAQPLSYVIRILGMQRFDFGPAHDWWLLATCRWRVEGPGSFSLSWEHFRPERCDDHAKAFYQTLKADPPLVASVGVEEDGGLKIEMTGGYLLAFEPGGFVEEGGWGWRFMYPDHPRSLYMGDDGLTWDTKV